MRRQPRRPGPSPSAVRLALTLLVSISGTALARAQAAPPPTPLAPAQQSAAPPSPSSSTGNGPITVSLKSSPALEDWTKICGTDPGANSEVCYTTRDFVSDEGQPALAVAVYDIKSGPNAGRRVVRFMTPVSLLLPPGIRFAVDQAKGVLGQYQVCLQTGCLAEAVVQDDTTSAMKKGTTMAVTVMNQAGREITFAVPLTGFGKTYDGPPLSPEALKKQQDDFKKEAERRAQDLRTRILQSPVAPSVSAPPKP